MSAGQLGWDSWEAMSSAVQVPLQRCRLNRLPTADCCPLPTVHCQLFTADCSTLSTPLAGRSCCCAHYCNHYLCLLLLRHF